MVSRAFLFAAGVAVVALAASVPPPPRLTARTVDYNRDVRPILSEHCYRCHSAKAGKVRAGLQVDSREGLLKGGESGTVLVPGNPGQSRLIEAVRYATPELQMPPRRRLSDEQVAALKSKGIAFVQDPRDEPWLWREARLVDPAGNVICLYHAGENRLHPPWRLSTPSIAGDAML